MILVVGLGNPGKEYASTRHNIGFIAIDFLVNRYNLSFESNKKYNLISASGNVPLSSPANNNYEKIIFAKPQSYMNLSGIPVSQLANFYKIPSDKIIVLHDEADLELGKIKFKLGGGNAGHNGLRSIDQHLGKNYYRIRIGIGRHNNQDLGNYVLGKFTSKELEILNISIAKITEFFPLILNNEIDLFQKSITN